MTIENQKKKRKQDRAAGDYSFKIRKRVVLKKVRFSEEEPTLHYYAVNNEELSNMDEKGAETELDTNEKISKVTEEITLLSSVHGEARRKLRHNTKYDLQSTIKYGVKSRGHSCRRTGLPRWKYVFGNVVYITDSTSTMEVTSYKQAVTIQPAEISQAMMCHHLSDVQSLKEDPQLCATHTIIVIDQSGSMRMYDVSGFRTRSQAAYGLLALDFVAEQLETKGDDGIIDAISIIEMNDTGSLLYHRVPLDWILFNNILDRQEFGTPHSHGNYNASLSTAFSVIRHDLEKCAGLEIDDLPSYMLIFLSDGKPSDHLPDAANERMRIIANMSQKLKYKLTVNAMGLGASGADFSTLQGMVEIARENGAEGTFNHAHLSAAVLSSTFSAISTTMTATRTEMLSVNKDHVDEKQLKNVVIRSNRVPLRERKLKSYTNNISRWRYDHVKYKKGEYAWTKIPFIHKVAVGFDMETQPFGKGAERLAYMFHEVDKCGKQVGKPMVAKESIYIKTEKRKVGFHMEFCRVQRKANMLAIEFNKAVKKAPNLQPINMSRAPAILFLKCFVYEYIAEDKELCGLLVEQYLKGKFTKYNGNNGHVYKGNSGSTIELKTGKFYLTDFLQAFSHWVYVYTDHNLLLCDLQGVLNEEGRYPKFELTDPVICTKKGRRYGETNLRVKGMLNFQRTHRCTAICKGLGLPQFGIR